MINYKTASTQKELEGILLLQKENLAYGLTEEELKSQGFVTVNHNYAQLQKLNDIENHIIAIDDEKVIGYVLAMTQQSKFELPILIPMFDIFSTIMYENKIITDHNFIVVGQVCISKNYRGKSIFKRCYQEYKNYYQTKYDFAITEIASTNLRSLSAHKKIGFDVIHTYESPDKTVWIIVLWDWKKVQ